MTITLPAALETYVIEKVASGLYQSADEVVVESLGLLIDEERWRRGASAKIDEGMRDLNEGFTLTDAESRREMAAYKERWRAGA
jgi:putative addiction module CopG family antidote